MRVILSEIRRKQMIKDRQPDVRTICDVCECRECPRYGDDCDGKDIDDD